MQKGVTSRPTRPVVPSRRARRGAGTVFHVMTARLMASLPSHVADRLDYLRRRSGKTCRACGEAKRLSEFGPDPATPDGLDRYCRACRAARARARRQARAAAADVPYGDGLL